MKTLRNIVLVLSIGAASIGCGEKSSINPSKLTHIPQRGVVGYMLGKAPSMVHYREIKDGRVRDAVTSHPLYNIWLSHYIETGYAPTQEQMDKLEYRITKKQDGG